MGELEAAISLALQVVEQAPIEEDEFRQKFQRDLTLQHIVAGQPNDTHPAPSQNPFQGVAIEQLLSGDKIPKSCVQPAVGGHKLHRRKPNHTGSRNKDLK